MGPGSHRIRRFCLFQDLQGHGQATVQERCWAGQTLGTEGGEEPSSAQVWAGKVAAAPWLVRAAGGGHQGPRVESGCGCLAGAINQACVLQGQHPRPGGPLSGALGAA